MREAAETVKASSAIRPSGDNGYYVAGSLGPFGATLGDGSEYTGVYTCTPAIAIDTGAYGDDVMAAWHDKRVMAMIGMVCDTLAL